MEHADIRTRLRRHVPAAGPGLLAIALLLLWAVHDGGYDAETWYWGALVLLGGLAATLVALGPRRARLTGPARCALVLFVLYVAWSFLSATWAQSPGDAIQGSDRALAYLLLFAFMLVLPWTAEGAVTGLLTFAIGIGVIAVVLLVRLAAHDQVPELLNSGRLAAPTGYYNATAALFTVAALISIALAGRRRLPGLLRGLLLALTCAELQLGVVGQSRGWLFTLPLVAVAAIAVAPSRLRMVAAAVLPVVGVLPAVNRLLAVYDAASTPALSHVAARAGQAGLLLCGAVFVVGTIVAWADGLRRGDGLSPARRRAAGWIVTGLALAALIGGGVAVSHGHPFRFISREWRGFSHQTSSTTGSHFTDVGSGRYDFWRVSLDAFVAHPIGGLGQDNFADYYVKRRHNYEEPSWTHSLELRLLVHTGIVGFLLFTGFLVAAVVAALRARRQGRGLLRVTAGIALLPLIPWLIHGSVDWFWEIPALSGPALGFLGLAGSLGAQAKSDSVSEATAGGATAAPERARRSRRAFPRPAAVGLGGVALLAGVVVLGFPYLSIREVSLASNARFTDPAAALSDLAQAARLNPWSSEPGRLGGAIAMQTGRYAVAERRFAQSTDREPGGWFSWLGAGLAASALGRTSTAVQDYKTAYRINARQPAITAALARARSSRPLTYNEMLKLLVLTQ
ncbi:MAG: hypothetical protein ACRDNK_03080 [Solirubrobacteraceae bacterium]